MEASREVLDQIENAQATGAEYIEVSATVLYRLSIAPTYEADSPVLDGLVRSGRLEIIRDPRVVAALASWDRRLRDYSEVAQIARRNADTLLVPALVKRGDVGFGLINDDRQLDQSTSDSSPSIAIQIDNEIKGLIAQKVENVRHATGLLNGARGAAEEAVAALDIARSN
jgi:hypothetical protein